MRSLSPLNIASCGAITAAATMVLLFVSAALHAQTQAIAVPSPYVITAQSASGPSAPGSVQSPQYQRTRPRPLLHGDGFDYRLYYNYRLTPHIILRPNLQNTTKPGAVEEHSQRYVGGLSAGIQF